MLPAHSSVLEAPLDRRAALPYRYFVYGITLDSEIPLALPEQGNGELGRIELCVAPAAHFSQAACSLARRPDPNSFYQSAFLRDGSTYVRWESVGEFLISADGSEIVCRQHDGAHEESFQVYLLGQALSYALIKRGFEPLHATAVVVNDGAAVLLGNSGFGKSSLAACFLDAGYRLLTDDLLVLRSSSSGIMAYPGPPRIKLFPRLARRFLPEAVSGVTMNTGTEKLILPLDQNRRAVGPVPLKAIYALLPPATRTRRVGNKPGARGIRIAVLPPREGFLALIKNTFNYRIVNPTRLERLFEAATLIASVMPVQKVSYPRILQRLPAVRDALLADLNSRDDRKAPCRD